MSIYQNSKYVVNVVRSSSSEERQAYYNASDNVSLPEILLPKQIIPDVDPFDAWYEVVNLEYGVAEFRTPNLPLAMQAADSLEDELVNKPWVSAIAANKRYRDSMEQQEKAISEVVSAAEIVT